MSGRNHFVHLGYAVGTGNAVMIPIRHMVVTGQTQESGKTTTLEALIARADAGRGKDAARKFRAIAFITKRGEGAFTTGVQMQPYFRTQKADWQYVSSLIDATMGEKNKFLRSFLMKVCRTTKTLEDVLVQVRLAKDTATRFITESVYTEIEGYLELVVPQLAQLPPAHKLTLTAGLNVMDVSPYTTELQALVIRATLDHVYEHEEDVVVVIPEAWEFLPEGRGSPVKAAAEVLIRKGAALGNYMWLDSQDLAGVWKTAVRACPVALIGVQREANEIKRTLANIHTEKKPKAADVASLELGEFFACWGTQAVKTYVQPAWLEHIAAMEVARGTRPRHLARRPGKELARARRPVKFRQPTPLRVDRPESVGSILERVTSGMKPGDEREVDLQVVGDVDVVDAVRQFVERGQRAQTAVVAELERVKGERFMSDAAEKKLDQLLARFDGLVKTITNAKYGPGTATMSVGDGGPPSAKPIAELTDRELDQLVSTVADVVIERLQTMLDSGDRKVATLLEVLRRQPELRIKTETRTIEATDEDLQGRIGILIAEGFFDEGATAYSAWVELEKRQWKHDRRTVERAVANLATQGFLRKEGRGGYVVVSGMKRNVVKVPA